MHNRFTNYPVSHCHHIQLLWMASLVFANALAQQWHAMTKEEKLTATDDGVADLMEQRKEHTSSAVPVLPIQSFHDARQTLGTIETEVRLFVLFDFLQAKSLQLHALHARTGVKVTLFAARSNSSHYLKPYMLSTSTTGADFFQVALGQDIFDVASRYKSYLLAGVKSKHASTQCCLCILIFLCRCCRQSPAKALKPQKGYCSSDFTVPS